MLARPLTHADIVGAYAGLRPLASAGGIDTTRVSREHEVLRSAPGFVSVVSGKYTTYRLMARDAVDASARELEFRESSESKPAGPPACPSLERRGCRRPGGALPRTPGPPA